MSKVKAIKTHSNQSNVKLLHDLLAVYSYDKSVKCESVIDQAIQTILIHLEKQ